MPFFSGAQKQTGFLPREWVPGRGNVAWTPLVSTQTIREGRQWGGPRAQWLSRAAPLIKCRALEGHLAVTGRVIVGPGVQVACGV